MGFLSKDMSSHKLPLCQETISKETSVLGTDFHRLTNNALLPVLLQRTWMIRAQALQGHRTQQLMLVNRFPTLFLYLFNITSQLVIVSLRKCRSGSQNTHSHDHWTLASLSPRLLLSVFISSPFLSLLLLWILACHQEFCSTFPLPLPAVPLLLRLWDKKPNSVAQPAPSERFLFL